MPTPNPLLLIAELSYKCPLHCPYCSNPLSIGDAKYSDELPTEDWVRVFHEAGELGVLQLALTGGEPLVRKDAEVLTAAAKEAGLYSNLITAGTPFTRKRAEALKEAGLDNVQISIQDSDPISSDRIAGTKSFSKKIEAAHLARELGFPLTINVVLHRQNLDRIEEIIQLAEDLDARRIELANSQYMGWAVINRTAMMPTRAQLEHGEAVVQEARERIGPKMEILWVLPDYYEEYPKPCMGGWGHDAMVIAPNGDVLPCQAASTIPDMEFANVRDTPLADIWFESDAFNRFRGTDWMPEPCKSCPLDRQEVDFGGCRCQAMALLGDATMTDPVCHLSPHHSLIVDAREAAIADGNGDFVYRTLDPVPGGAKLGFPQGYVAAESAIAVAGLGRDYGRVRAVDAVDLDVRPGEFFGFLGPNGAGKTTTIRMLTTLLQPSRGTARIDGLDVQTEALGVRRRIGVVFQETTLDLDLTAEENLRFCTRLYGLPRREGAARVHEALELFGLLDRRAQRVRSFSGGMRRALDLARGVLHRPSIVFLDEPTLGLDPGQRRRIWGFLKRLSAEHGTTLFLTTHYLEEADPCDRVAIVDRGRIVAAGEPAELKRRLGRDRVEIRTERPEEFAARVRELTGVEPQQAQHGLSVFVEDAETVMPSLLPLAREGAEFGVSHPTLEDVFLDVTRRPEAAAA